MFVIFIIIGILLGVSSCKIMNGVSGNKKLILFIKVIVGVFYGYAQEVKNDTIEIEKLELIGHKKLIERKADKLVFYVENSHVSTGVNGFEVLQNTPKLDVSRGGIRLIGKKGLRIMVNGKFLNLPSEDLESYLKNLRSDNISKIEIITIPPAKYDAQGNSGLINIILKKNSMDGWKGNISSSFIQRSSPSFLSGIAMYYTSKKINVSLNISNNTETKNINSNTILNSNLEYRVSDIRKNDLFRGNDVNFNIGYLINNKSEIGILYNGSITRNMQNGEVKNLINTSIDNTSQYTLYQDNLKPIFQSLSAYYDLNINNNGAKMSLNLNYLNKKSSIDKLFSTTSNMGLNRSNYQSEAEYDVISSKLDFIFPFKFIDVEMGIKYTFIKNSSSIKYYNIISEDYILDLDKSNRFTYEEGIYAYYLSFFKKVSEKLEMQMGLRVENTQTKGVTESEKQKRYFYNVFPSFYLNYIPNQNNIISIAYSKRIGRPSFYQVNPFRVYIDSYSYDSGNPNLSPSFTHNIELSYLYKNNLTSTLYYSYLKSGKDYVIIPKDNYNSVISMPINFYNQHTLGIDVSYTYKPFKWLNSFNNFNYYYNYSEPYIKNIIDVPNFNGYGIYISSKNVLKISNNTLLTLNFFQNFPMKEGIVKIYNRASLDMGIRLLFIDKTLQVSLSVNDIFAQNRNKVKEYYSNYNYQSLIYNDIRNINLTLNYNFGNKKVKNKNKKINIEERDRL